MLKIFSFLSSMLLFVALLTSSFMIPTVNAHVMSPQEMPGSPSIVRQENPSQALDESGKIRPGFKGSFDPKGYRMEIDADGSPRFVKDSPDSPALAAIDAGKWAAGNGINGANSVVRKVKADGQGNVYFGGQFSAVGNVYSPCIVKWDGAEWAALGFSATRCAIDSIELIGNSLYVGGDFSIFEGAPGINIAKLDLTTGLWSNLSNGISGFVLDMATDGTNLYIAGSFTSTAGGTGPVVAMNRVGKWDGTSWSALGAGINNTADAIEIDGSDVYVGGIFTTAGGNSANRIAKWNGSTWSALGTGMNDRVSTLVMKDGILYAGGQFGTAGGISAQRVAKWNGTAWSALSSGSDIGVGGSVSELVFVGSDLYVAGSFNSLANSGSTTRSVAKWDGTTWTAYPGTSPGPGFFSMAYSGGEFYFGGQFLESSAGSYLSPSNFLLKGLPGAQSGIGEYSKGPNGQVRAVLVDGNDIYVGGDFTKFGDVSVNRVVRFDSVNGSWVPMGNPIDGTDGSVRALAISGGVVYVGGFFTTAGGVTVNNIATFDPGTSVWSALGVGVNNGVQSISTSGSNVFVGGYFTQAGGSAANYVARWNGSAWSALGSGVGDVVETVAASGTDLYAGGFFTTAGGSPANYIAKWNGSAWSALGSGVDNGVHVIKVDGSNVYVGGRFSNAGGSPSKGIAKWNGSAWSGFGSGVPGAVVQIYSIFISGTDLIVGGFFAGFGSTPPRSIAKWDGSSWTELGGGANDYVYTIQELGDKLILGGSFTTLGTTPSAYFGSSITDAFVGSVDSDWHNPGNWDGGTVPSGDVVISGADVEINASAPNLTFVVNLQINPGRKLTIAPGKTLIVFNSISLGGNIEGGGSVRMSGIKPDALVRMGSGVIKASFNRRVYDNAAYSRTYLFPVGTDSGYSPVTIVVNEGSAEITVKANEGAYTDPATGLPTNTLARWWNLIDGCSGFGVAEQPNGCSPVTDSDITFRSRPSDFTIGNPATYRVFDVRGGNSTLIGGTFGTEGTDITVFGITDVTADWTLGQLTTTAAPGVIAGRVLDGNGRPVANASVLMTKPNGDVVTVKTNNFGKYSFTGITAGETYVVMAQTRQHLYMPKVVSLSDDLTDLDFRP